MEGDAERYEFTSAQNTILQKAATWTGLFAWIMMASGGLMAVGGILSFDSSAIGALIAAGIYFIIGLHFRESAASMKAVVHTSGNDIEHLMAALDKLGSAFMVMGILFLLGVILFVTAIVALSAMMAPAGL